jgi:hypothetical protein
MHYVCSTTVAGLEKTRILFKKKKIDFLTKNHDVDA